MIVGMAGAVALNQMAIHRAMELYEIEDRRGCFEKVIALGRHFVRKQAEEAKAKR